MKTFLAKLIFNININNGIEYSEFDEQVRLIESVSIEDALYKARMIGKKEEETFVNISNDLVKWHFVDVCELYALDEVRDGQQLYSNSIKMNDANSYIQYVRNKSMEIQTKSLTFA
jgi:hypothetical protein